MTKRIFRSILAVALAVLLASLVLTVGVLHGYFQDRVSWELESRTGYIAHGVEQEGLDYLTGLPRDCAAAAGDTVVTARGEHWVGTAAAPPALDDAGLTAELILQDTAGGTDYLYFAEGDKTGQDGV